MFFVLFWFFGDFFLFLTNKSAKVDVDEHMEIFTFELCKN